MAGFEHYMYVVECSDGSLYTGYAVDVESRVAAHNAGKGAKYTKARLPVKLLACARFYSKPRAMSAEYHFKQLSRDDKDALLARAAKEPFEEVLCSAIPALSDEPVGEFVAHVLHDNIDLGYRDFTAKLIPNISKKTIVGVRTPVLRDIAKKVLKRDDLQDFLDASPHATFEEQQIHAFAIGYMKDYDQALCATRQFLPSVDNWATCDQLGTKPLMKDPARTLEAVCEWIASPETYISRFGIGVLMQHYLDDLFQPEFLDLVAQRYTPDDYYLNMMRAWFFAECVAKQTDAALPFLEGDILDEWTRRKGIQKAIESRRVSVELKDRLRNARKRS